MKVLGLVPKVQIGRELLIENLVLSNQPLLDFGLRLNVLRADFADRDAFQLCSKNLKLNGFVVKLFIEVLGDGDVEQPLGFARGHHVLEQFFVLHLSTSHNRGEKVSRSIVNGESSIEEIELQLVLCEAPLPVGNERAKHSHDGRE